jgi:hypothetical protein
MVSKLARFESSGFHLWRDLKALVYAAPVDNEEALHHRLVDVSEYPQLPQQL